MTIFSALSWISWGMSRPRKKIVGNNSAFAENGSTTAIFSSRAKLWPHEQHFLAADFDSSAHSGHGLPTMRRPHARHTSAASGTSLQHSGQVFMNFRGDVKDEPCPELARRGQHSVAHLVLSFQFVISSHATDTGGGSAPRWAYFSSGRASNSLLLPSIHLVIASGDCINFFISPIA